MGGPIKGEAAWRYHKATKHSFWSVRLTSHTLDWENQPIPFKLYRGLDPIPLPQQIPTSGVHALKAIATGPSGDGTLDLFTLAGLLHFSAGITKRLRYPGGTVYFRAAACTGALYHIDLYLVCGPLPDLEAGVYHYGPHDHSLRCLRRGDFRPVVAKATGWHPWTSQAPAIVVFASTFWRNAWKYRARTYRHCFWDSGTILANMMAMANSYAIPCRLLMGFVDDEINHLLGLDGRREAALALAVLGEGSPCPQELPTVPALNVETAPLSKRELLYPEIVGVHEASSLHSAEEVALWRRGFPASSLPPVRGTLFPLHPLPLEQGPTIEEAILRRGSARRFLHRPITLDQLSTIIDRAAAGITWDVTPRQGLCLNALFLLVHAVEGLPAGAYLFRPETRELELLREGGFRKEGEFLALEQALGADASVDFFFLSPLQTVLHHLGDRGYRAAQMEAGIAGGRVYLSAYALGIGATGLTFYDDEVIRFFSPQAAQLEPMFLVATGVPAPRPRTL